jgi:hypothetical protein
MALYIPGPYSMQLIPVGKCERPDIPISDAAVPLRALIVNFTGHSLC